MAHPETGPSLTDDTFDQTPEHAAEHSVVLRIVVYGPASAGKTTTARALGEGFGRSVTTPVENEDGATVFFDWMEHVGGVYQGRPILTQVITVPGHDRSRRLALLCQADVVIYVADTSPAGMIESLALWQELGEELDRLRTSPGIVIQANKRDHPAAVSLPTFRSWMALEDDQTVVETIASNGDGVRQCYVFAVRKGLERVANHADLAAAAVPLDPDRVLADLSSVASEATPDRRSVTDAAAVPDRRTATERPAASPAAEVARSRQVVAEPAVRERRRPPVSPDHAAVTPAAPAPAAPAPVAPAPLPVTPTPVTPTPVTPAPVAQAPSAPTEVAPAPPPVTPAPVAPAPVAPTPVTRAPIAPTPAAPIEVAPAPIPAASLDELPPPPGPDSMPLPPPGETDAPDRFLGRLFKGLRG